MANIRVCQGVKPFFLYILRCSDQSFYVGHTDDLEKRMGEHTSGLLPCYTRRRRPVELVFTAEFDNRPDAIERERQIKGWSRKKKQALIDGDWNALKQLSVSKSRPSTSLRANGVAKSSDFEDRP